MNSPPQIRPFREGDLDACYAISLATGHAGGDASHLYRDPKIMGHIYIAPYALLEPALCFVAQDRDGVAGFVAGVVDTAAWEERLDRDWWPSLRRQYADPIGVSPGEQTADQRRASMIHHPTATPAEIVTRYPAHLHMNLLPRLQRRGLGSLLLGTWLAAARTRGARSFHIGVNRMNTGAMGFWTKRGFAPLMLDRVPESRTCWMGNQAIV
ncbi:MAG: GNAT family N-acetyltransferase [Reyranella sp.]|uniref:GNAT family N-acetyltransferase n=1 Tax=Reyranella sp. TaxID=1929291 RepID=UPI0011FE0239|nr:GNAT family N-acetyltransferase [Reyranella sp.]TAJ97242.1 MAG: GNAT family N-acetyltransferase [Reyranella sp.]TBR29136.1 MAG: GNAT family N-acetyltransferase [Reyranella sp.]